MTYQRFPELQGYMSDVEIYELLCLAKDATVLEIGAWKGRSTLAMATVAKKVYTIDHFRGDDFAGRGHFLPEFCRNIEASGVKNVFPLVGPQEAILPMLKHGKFDFLFYDADHTAEATRFALDIFREMAWCGATVAVHDYDPHYPQYAGVIAEVDEFERIVGVKKRVVGTLAIFDL